MTKITTNAGKYPAEKRKTDAQRVLEWLNERGSITTLDAMGFGCMRLASRISELRRSR